MRPHSCKDCLRGRIELMEKNQMDEMDTATGGSRVNGVENELLEDTLEINPGNFL